MKMETANVVGPLKAVPMFSALGEVAIFAGNDIRSVMVARMEVPCCGGIVRAVQEALRQAGRMDVPVREITVSVDGAVEAED